MTANQERRLLLAALDYAEADRLCRESNRRPDEVSRSAALKARRMAKKRLLSAAGEHRRQIDLDLRAALTKCRSGRVAVEHKPLPVRTLPVGYFVGDTRRRGPQHET